LFHVIGIEFHLANDFDNYAIMEVAMLTALGKELRRLRIEKDEKMLDMARRLQVSTGMMSSVERGKKTPPKGFEEAVIRAYSLASDAAEHMRRAADQSRNAFTLQPTSEIGRDTAGLLARRMDELTDAQLEGIQKILDEGGKSGGQ